MNTLIREAIVSDFESIWDLNCKEMGYPFSLDATKNKLEQLLQSNTDKIYVAVVEGAVAGYVHVNNYDLLYAPHMKNIMGIAVSSQYRRNGIGRTLLNQVELWGRETGACAVRLVSGASRIDAHAFYHQCGYSGDREQINLKKML